MPQRSPRPAREQAQRSARAETSLPPAIGVAVIEAIDAELGKARVRRCGPADAATGGGRELCDARLTYVAGYTPAEGDRVLIASDGADVYVVSVLMASNLARPNDAAIALPDGGRAELQGRALEVRDAEGRLVVRYEDGAATISPASGDLRLCAPQGSVRIESAVDVSIEAGRDLSQGAARRVDIAAGSADEPQVRVEPRKMKIKADQIEALAKVSRLVAGEVSVIARAAALTASHLAQNVERYDLTATRLVERTRDAFREAQDLAQTKAGRARTLVREVFTLQSKRSVLVSDEDTSIDGRKIFLG